MCVRVPLFIQTYKMFIISSEKQPFSEIAVFRKQRAAGSFSDGLCILQTLNSILMKHTLLSLLVICSTAVMAQQNLVYVTNQEYDVLKQANQLDPQAQYVFTDILQPNGEHYEGTPKRNSVCDCMVPLDSTFLLAMLPNDDQSSAIIPLPFSFDFYGTQYNSLYINNNGNISFQAPYITYTANPFPDATYNMIAPFWGDVDTRAANGGNVWYKLTPNALVVVWDSVGYFAMHDDLRSTFQLIISNGTDSLVPAGNNVSFCYGDMQWTTGDASSGMGGFGGSAATVGVNIGNGTDYFQVGQFDAPGTGFDGPYGAADQVDFLDNQEVYFNIAGAASSNTPPILISSVICDTIDVYTGDTLQKSTIGVFDFTFSTSTPELNQSLTNVITASAPDALTYTVTQMGTEFYRYECEFTANGLSPGMYTVNLTSTDNGTPVASSSSTVYIRVIYDESLGLSDKQLNNSFNVVPNPTTGTIAIHMNSQYDNAELTVMDITGKPCMSGSVSQMKTIDLSTLTNGVYFVVMTQQGQLIGTQKVVKH